MACLRFTRSVSNAQSVAEEILTSDVFAKRCGSPSEPIPDLSPGQSREIWTANGKTD